MTLWHNADFDLPALAVVSLDETIGGQTVLMSDNVLVYTEAGEQIVAAYEEDEFIKFRGWVTPCCCTTLHGVTHWTELPRPPKGAAP